MYIIIISIILMFLLLSNNKMTEFFTMEQIKSNIDNRAYSVVKSYNDKDKAANLIASINEFTILLIKTLKERYVDNSYDSRTMTEDEYDKGHELTLLLIKRYKSESLQENEPESVDKTSYTTNKGEIIGLCLREKKSGKNEFHDLSVLKFVLIHEISHIVTPELNHSVLFWTNFRFLLDFCDRYKLYTAPLYDNGANKINYCGLDISYTPILDTTLISFFK